MNWKRTFLFVLILGIISGVYFLKVSQFHAIKTTDLFLNASTSTSILSLKPIESVEYLSIKHTGEKEVLEFQKHKEHWQIIRPIDYPAESVLIDGFVSLLKVTPRFRSLSLEGVNLSDFGFQNPKLTVCVGTSPNETRCLIIGNQAAIGKGFYARWTDEIKYFLVSDQAVQAFDKSLYTLRQKQIFSLLDKEIKLIRFLSTKKEMLLIREGKNWLLKKPIEASMGPDAMDQLLLELHNLYVKEFLDGESHENQKLGFRKAKRTIQIEFSDGSKQTLIQGDELKGREAYYANLQERHVFLVSAYKLNKIEEAFHSLIS